MKNAIFWDVTSCSSSKNRRFRGIYRLYHQGDKNRLTRNVSSNYQPKHAAKKLLDTADVTGSRIPFSLMMQAMCSSETFFLTRATRRHITQEGILG
jgi:hypothetical protein